LTSPDDRRKALEILDEGMANGARARELALLLGVGLTTLQRWRRQFVGDGDGVDRRKGSHRHVAHRLSEEERQRILLTCNEPEFAALPPGQIVPVLADRGLYIGSERSFYRVLHAHGQVHRRGRARPPQEPRPVPRLRAIAPNPLEALLLLLLGCAGRACSAGDLALRPMKGFRVPVVFLVVGVDYLASSRLPSCYALTWMPLGHKKARP